MIEPVETSRFVFGIRGTRYPDDTMLYVPQDANEKIPREVVIMQLKAYLKKLEKEYLNQ